MVSSNNRYITTLSENVLQNRYTSFYLQIITNALHRANSRAAANKILGYSEKHHILPKFFRLGGEKENDNFAYLTAREHYMCHLLLTRMLPVNSNLYHKAWAAFNPMCLNSTNQKRNLEYNSRFYEKSKAMMSESLKGKPSVRKGIKDVDFFGLEKATEINETRKKTREENGTKYIPWNKGLTDVYSEESLEAMRESKRGDNNPNRNREYPESERKMLSDRHKNKPKSESQKANMSKAAKKPKKKMPHACPHCGGWFSVNGYTKSHGNNCRFKPTE
jgi:hypothetical protein